MFQLHYPLLLLSMGVFSHMVESQMQHDTTVDLATVLNRVNVLEAEQHSIISALQKNVDDLAATKTELQTAKSRIRDQEEHSSAMNSSLNVLQQQQQQQNCSSSLNALKTELASKTRNVAVSVYTKNGSQYAGYVPVKFDGVHYNAGNGYRTSTGKFTAPVSGTYIFHTELEVGSKPLHTYIRIKHSGTTVSSGFGHLTQNNHDITIPVTALFSLKHPYPLYIST